MKRSVVFLAVVLGCVWAAPVEDGLEPASCTDAVVLGAANQAMDKINKDRAEGYVYAVHDLVNAHTKKHGENSIVFYLTMNVVETNCSILSKTHFKNCEVRGMTNNPVYGQCKVVIFISRVHRVVRLYEYNCAVRPVAPVTVHDICPDCPTLIDNDSEKINKTVTLTLAKFNNESGLANQFALLKVNRATAGMGMGMIYGAEYTIQETTCAKTANKTDNCPMMDCEFAHKGFCKGFIIEASRLTPEQFVSIDCQIYEPEAAEREKKLHLLGGETDHAHNDTHTHHHAHDHGHGHAHDHKHEHGHDHLHDHTKRTHDHMHKHPEGDDHHHTHDHHGGSAHRHAHDHSHDHGINHDHIHEHHGKAHDHSGDFPNQHHKYEHAASTHTHEHDHEMALDHDHKHGHLHDHEHHHHHHAHEHETMTHDNPKGMWRELPRLGAPTTLPAFPDTPAAGPKKGVTLPLKPDPQIPDQTEPTILPFPTKKSSECPPPLPVMSRMSIGKLFAEDPEFKPSA